MFKPPKLYALLPAPEQSRPGAWLRSVPIVVAACCVAVLVACGGGGGGGGGQAGAQDAQGQALTSGQITGFGSIIVNGIRFDNTAARVVDEDGNPVGNEQLALGTTVAIDSGPISTLTGRAVANEIKLGAPIRGPVDSIDPVQMTLSVLGQTIQVNALTVFDPALTGGFGGITVGEVLLIDVLAAPNLSVATRIAPPSFLSSYRTRGVISALDPNAKTFQIGSLVINYASAQPQPPAGSLANGQNLRVTLQTVPVGGQWIASYVTGADLRAHDTPDARIQGMITAYTSPIQFSVDGLSVDGSVAGYPNGQADLGLGAKVEAKGAIVNGVLVAALVTTEKTDHRVPGKDFELHGTISGLDTQAKTFSLRGLTVDYSATMTWRNMKESDLANGMALEVQGDLSPDGITLVAVIVQPDQ